VFFLPITQDFFDTNKWMLLSGIAVAGVIVWALKTVAKQELHITFPPITLGIIGLILASLASLTFVSSNKIDALTHPFGIITLISLLLISVFTLPFFPTHEQKNTLRFVIEIIAGFLGIFVIYQHIGIQRLLFPNNTMMLDPLWNPTGSPVGLLTLFVITTPWLIESTISSFKKSREISAALYGLGTLFILVAIGLTLWKWIPTLPSKAMPIAVGAEIAGKTIFSDVRHILFGTGIDQYMAAFTKYRPVGLNLTPLWNIAFTTSSTTFFHIATTYGLLGLVTFVLFFITLWETVAHTYIGRIQIGLLILFSLFLPPTFLFWIIITLLIMTSSAHVSRHEVNAFGSVFFTLIPSILALIAIFGLTRFYVGELRYYQSITAGERNNGTLMYQKISQAIASNPINATYHLQAATTSLTLANALLTANRFPNGQLQKLPEDEKQNITALIDNAIRHSKLAAILSPNNVMVWSTMAMIYQQLIGVAKDADVWAIASYQKAIQLDPTNPVLRMDIGNLYTQLQRFDEGESALNAALKLKPNYANASFNLGYLFKQKGDLKAARSAFNQTLNMIPPNSEEQIKVLEEMKTIEE